MQYNFTDPSFVLRFFGIFNLLTEYFKNRNQKKTDNGPDERSDLRKYAVVQKQIFSSEFRKSGTDADFCVGKKCHNKNRAEYLERQDYSLHYYKQI